MKYVTLKGLRKYLDTEADAWFEAHPDARRLLSDCEIRTLAYIIPNTPACKAQVGALQRAVYAQLVYETSAKNQQLADMPDGLKSFTVNGFSAQFGGSTTGTDVSATGLCREARAELLLSGLLYRGVDCTC